MEKLKTDLIEMANFLHRQQQDLENSISGQLPMERERSEIQLQHIELALQHIGKTIDSVQRYLEARS